MSNPEGYRCNYVIIYYAFWINADDKFVCLGISRYCDCNAQIIRLDQYHKTSHPERVGGAIPVSISHGNSLLLCDIYLRCLS